MVLLNEREYAEQCIRNNDIGENPKETLQVLARYYYYVCGYKPKKIESTLNDFIELTYPRYSASKQDWIDTIKDISKHVRKYELFESDGVWVTERELEKIKKLKNTVLEKLVFTMLCLAKYHNQRKDTNNNWVNTEIKEIYDMAGINCSMRQRAQRIGKLIKKGYIRYAEKIDNLNMQILFMDDTNDKHLLIYDFRELGNEYLLYNGGNYIRCAECGRLVKNNKYGNRKYCSTCAAYVPQDTKQVVCVDCGKIFLVDARITNKCRCDNCQKEKIKADTRKRMKKYREAI